MVQAQKARFQKAGAQQILENYVKDPAKYES